MRSPAGKVTQIMGVMESRGRVDRWGAGESSEERLPPSIGNCSREGNVLDSLRKRTLIDGKEKQRIIGDHLRRLSGANRSKKALVVRPNIKKAVSPQDRELRGRGPWHDASGATGGPHPEKKKGEA